MGERLVAEERALGDLEAQLQAAPAPRSKVIPQPAAIAKYVEHLAELLEAGDLVRAAEVLRSALAPFRLIPREGGGYRMTGGA